MKNPVATHIPDTTACPLHRRTPYGAKSVSMTQLSIARHYGGINVNGEAYTYFADTDELVRDDVLRWQMTEQRKAKRAARQAKQESLL